MPHELCAVVGVGQTKYSAARGDVSIPGLLREAAGRALEDAQMTWADIDAVVIGKAPDMFEGVMMPELYLADALGAVGKPMLWEPIRYLETCPSSDGACAMVLTNEAGAARSSNPAWVRATEIRSEPTMFAGRDAVNPRAGQDCATDLYKKAGITNPRQEIDCAEIYVPFSWYEAMWMENLHITGEGEGW